MRASMFLTAALAFGLAASVPESGHTQPQASLFSKAGGSICGRILDDGPQPLHNARVNAVLSGGDSSWIAPIWSDSEGRFCLKDLKPGVYKLTVSHPEYVSEELSVSLLGGKSDLADTTLLKIVGELTDISRIVTRGNTAFTEEAIRSALLGDRAIVLASHPMAPRGAYVSTIERKILGGYRAGGYPNATVTARVSSDNSQIVANITEGDHYTNEAIVISGLHALKPELIKKQLREERIPTTSAHDWLGTGGELSNWMHEHSGVVAWPTGETSNFSEEQRQWMEGAVEGIFAEYGYWAPSLTSRVVPDPGRTTASLVIVVKDEGHPETIREIRVSGNTRNSDADLLRYLHIHVGMLVTQASLEQVAQRLTDSARFIRHEAKIEKIAEGSSGMRLLLDVTESKYAPPLSQPLSHEQEVGVRACRWLRNAPSRGDDIILEVWDPEKPLGYFQGIASSEGILIATLNAGPEGKRSIRNAGLLATKSGLFSVSGGRGLLGDMIGAGKAVNARVLFGARVENAEEHSNLGLMGGAFSRLSARKPYNFQIDAPPAACVSALGRGEVRVDNGLLTANSKEWHYVIAASTGEIREFLSSSKEDHFEFRMSFQKGAFAQAREQLLNLQRVDTSQPPSAWLGFLAQLLLDDDFSGLLLQRLDANQRLQAAMASKDVITATLSAFDPFLQTATSEKSFNVPADVATDKEVTASQLASTLAAFIFGHVNEWFSVNSWPWTVFHEAVYVLDNKTQYTGLEMQRVYDSEEIGPVGFLFCAEALRRIGSPFARDFAARGLTRLSKDDLRKDLQALFAGNGLVSQSADRFVASLRQLSEVDIAALAALLPPNLKPVMRKLAAQAKATPDLKGAVILTDVLEENWEDRIRPLVEQRLNALATASEESKAAGLF